jgi:hypothetical protein
MTPSPPASPAPDPAMPAGIRVTTIFLRVMVVALIFPALGGALSSLGYLAVLFGRHASPLNSLLFAVFAFAIFLALLATAMGCEWMIKFLRARHSPPGVLPRRPMPLHPALHIGLPLVQLTAAYSVLALLAWLVAVIGGFAPINWVWLAFWSVVAVASHLTIRWLKDWSSRQANAAQAL